MAILNEPIKETEPNKLLKAKIQVGALIWQGLSVVDAIRKLYEQTEFINYIYGDRLHQLQAYAEQEKQAYDAEQERKKTEDTTPGVTSFPPLHHSQHLWRKMRIKQRIREYIFSGMGVEEALAKAQKMQPIDFLFVPSSPLTIDALFTNEDELRQYALEQKQAYDAEQQVPTLIETSPVEIPAPDEQVSEPVPSVAALEEVQPEIAPLSPIIPDSDRQEEPQDEATPSSPTRASAVVLGRNTQTDKDITISDKERTSGISVLGGTGTGKSTLLTGVALGDIKNGHGCLFVDVDGDSIDQLLPRIPQERMQDVILLDLVALAKKGRFLGINPLPNLKTDTDTEGDPDAAIDRYMHVFKMLWNIGKDTPRLENTLRASLLTLAVNGLTIAEMPFLLRDKQFRKRCIEAIPVTFATEGVRWFWKYDFDELYLQEQLKYSDSTLNKVLQFLMVRKVLYAVAQNKTTVQFRELMDTKKIMLLKLSVQELGETAVRFLGAFLMAELKNALFSRSDVEASIRSFFSFLADEWQLYVTSDFKEILTRGRKYGIGAVLANQTNSQLDEVDTALQGIINQVNTHITFAVNEKDAATLAPYYARDPQPEMRYENTRIISPTPVDTTLLRKPHTNQLVNTLLKPWRETVQTALSRINEGSTPGSSTTTISRRGMKKIYSRPGREWSNRDAVEEAQEWLDKINGLFYKVMSEKNPRVIFPLDLLMWMVHQFELPFLDRERYQAMTELLTLVRNPSLRGEEYSVVSYYEHKYPLRERDKKIREFYPLCDYISWLFETFTFGAVHTPTEEQLALYHNLWLVPDDSFEQALTAFADEARKDFLQAMQGVLIVFRETAGLEYHISENGNQGQPILKRYNFADHDSIHRDVFAVDGAFDASRQWDNLNDALKRFELSWFPLEVVNTFQWEPGTIHIDSYGKEYSYDRAGWRLVAGQESVWLTNPAVREAIDRIFTEKREAFETFIRDYRAGMNAIAIQPIEEFSSVVEEKPGIQRTIADMRNEKAQELLGLPNGIAYVAIRSRGDRFKPRMETKPLPYLNPTIAARLLTEHREQALKNAEDYTTETTMVGLEVLKRRQRFGIASLSTVQTPQDADSTSTPVPISHARRRSQQLTPSHTPSMHLPDTTSDDDLLMSLYLFSYLKIDQLCRFLQKETSINNIRAKLKKPVDGGLVETQFLPRATQAGKTPMIYSLTAKGMKTLGEMRGFTPDATVKRGGFTAHTLLVNDLLISAALLPKVQPGITLVHFEHERLLKQRPISIGQNKAVIPDGYVSYTLSPPYGTAGELVGLCLEWDTGSESAYQWKDKLQAYTAFASGPYQERFGTDSLTIAVCLPAGDQRRLQQLVTLTEQVLENTRSYAELFVFAALDPASMNPLDLFTTPLFRQSFDTTLHSLIETMST